jgi:hypothetical protein
MITACSPTEEQEVREVERVAEEDMKAEKVETEGEERD